MALTQEQQDKINLKQSAIVHFVLGAAIQDDYGNWETAKCFLDKAVSIDNEIAKIQSICDVDLKLDLSLNTTCDITKKGIGYSAIGNPISNASVGCTVHTVIGTNVPPPYGEFKKLEFKLTDFKKEVTE